MSDSRRPCSMCAPPCMNSATGRMLGNYVSLHVGKKSLLLRETISSMEQRLVAHGFVRIHRSTIVNIHRVTELRSLSNAEFSVGLADGTTLKLSRNYRDALGHLTGHRS